MWLYLSAVLYRFFVLFVVLWSMPISWADTVASAPLRFLPVLDAGRVKPYDTFSKEVLQLIYGKTTYEGKPAYQIVTTWWLQPDLWKDKAIFEIKPFELKNTLGLPPQDRYFTLEQLIAHPRLPDLFQQLQEMREKKMKLDPFFQSVQRLEQQLFVYRELVSGNLVNVLPVSDSQWKNLNQLNDEERSDFLKITDLFIQSLTSPNSLEIRDQLERAIQQFRSRGIQVDDQKIKAEVHYGDFHPFRWAAIFYVLASLVMGLIWILKKNRLEYGIWIFALVGLILHIYGFGLRVYLSGRAPVTNMYETVVWVALGAVVFGMILEGIYRWRFILGTGTVVGAFCLILSDLAPAVLDPSIQPLEPVLRSNFWLIVHVTTIVISYAAFFLSFALGNLGLFWYLRDEKGYQERINAITLACYRSIQIGVSFLAPGIILGGVWADYSWGRFWDWDPKETWSLIALLGYLAILHARLVGWLKSFGLLASSVFAFNLIIMAWYGVNFVLGAGLHTYGFGAGGIEYVSAFVFLHLGYVIYALLVYRSRSRVSS
ncbi:MAG: cytochrome c biogenesis protein CcsA [Bdellovibrionaceae bacterium]|nr:cytochrome c biogenesis protein CcsA [Pseudobdellovibrionaceae bacterium]MDW8190506.1 cytochrome c biogenesis protein CcsA [Pseudobdellovibrionaceae bacterium]